MSFRPGSSFRCLRFACVFLTFGAAACETSAPSAPEMLIPDRQSVAELTRGDEQRLGEIVSALLNGDEVVEPLPAILQGGNVAAYIALRQRGRAIGFAWGIEKSGLGSLRTAVAKAWDSVAEGKGTADAAEVVLAHNFITVPYGKRASWFYNLGRGIYGIEIRHRDSVYRYSPTMMIASNWSFPTVVKNTAERQKVAEQDIPGQLSLRRFDAEQFLVYFSKIPRTIRLYRGNQAVPQSAVTQKTVGEFATGLSTWLAGNVNEDGRLTYLYWPSRGRESTSNNMVRQWMASLALARLAKQTKNPDVVSIVDRNVRYNLSQFYREENGLGLIEFDGEIKLGAVAMAALAIVEHPNRAIFARQEQALLRTVDRMWNPNGSFHTFLKPADRNDNQNLYTGEALYLWAMLYRQTEDPALLQKILKSYEYYRTWHLKNRNPAFVPWHTQAYYPVWRATQLPALRDWIFEMNDWLVGLQVPWNDYRDLDGRFFDPERDNFGPPHASSTAVYLEGLADAYRLAHEVGDAGRQEVYRRAILRGLRSLMQLQFADEIDMYYISLRGRARGGVRTTVYDNRIRVDNVQHALMAAYKVLTTFGPNDYRL